MTNSNLTHSIGRQSDNLWHRQIHTHQTLQTFCSPPMGRGQNICLGTNRSKITYQIIFLHRSTPFLRCSIDRSSSDARGKKASLEAHLRQIRCLVWLYPTTLDKSASCPQVERMRCNRFNRLRRIIALSELI